jgi:archaellum component FlaC
LLSGLWTASQSADFQTQIEQAKAFNNLLGPINDKIGEVNALIGGVAQVTSGVLSKLESLCAALGEDGPRRGS